MNPQPPSIWHEKARLKERWPRLTDTELAVANGRTNRLVGLLQEHYGISRDEAELELRRFLDDLEPRCC